MSLKTKFKTGNIAAIYYIFLFIIYLGSFRITIYNIKYKLIVSKMY